MEEETKGTWQPTPGEIIALLSLLLQAFALLIVWL